MNIEKALLPRDKIKLHTFSFRKKLREDELVDNLILSKFIFILGEKLSLQQFKR